MPYKTWKTEKGRPYLVWWLDTSTLDDEIQSFPWLKLPTVTRSKIINRPLATIENPTYSGKLCFTCQHVNFRWFLNYINRDSSAVDGQEFDADNSFIQYTTVVNAKRASRKGCPYCTLVLQFLATSHDMECVPDYDQSPGCHTSPKKWLTSLARSVFSPKISRTWITIVPLSPDKFKIDLSGRRPDGINLYNLGGDQSHCIIHDPRSELSRRLNKSSFQAVPGGTGSYADVSFIRDTLHQCVSRCKGHESRKPSDKDWTMSSTKQRTFFVDVKTGCIIEGTITQYDYIALSYVWGSVSNFELTSKNLHQFRRPGFLWDHLDDVPLTIRDAILVCQKLDYQFLWVDRLCIVQDSSSKHNIINNMHLVYAGADVTIVASSGKDANAGLPGVRPGSRKIYQPTAVTNSGDAIVAKLHKKGRMTNCEWHTRGWTLQEQICSQRLLAFGPDQMYFECGHYEQHEEDMVNGNIGHQTFESNFAQMEWNHYYRMTKDYLLRKLTYEHDIYNAYAGSLAKIAQTCINPIFISAMPAAYLDVMLLFKLDRKCSRRTTIVTPGTKPFPSWSWLGWRGLRLEVVDKDQFPDPSQLPCIQWLPDTEVGTLVDDMLVVKPDETITPKSLLQQDAFDRMEDLRNGKKKNKFQNTMLTELHLIADIAYFHIQNPNAETTEQSRFQIIDHEKIDCGMAILCILPSDRTYKFVKIALIAEIPSVDFKELGIQWCDTAKYVKRGTHRFYRALVVNDENERLGCAYVHIDAFDAVCQRKVDIVLH